MAGNQRRQSHSVGREQSGRHPRREPTRGGAGGTAIKVLVITGGPGVGKTTLVNSILKILRVKAVNVALAGAANAGSAATVIGNPQNILIGQVGRLDFWDFIIACGPPAIFGLMSVFAIVWLVWRRRFQHDAGHDAEVAIPLIDQFGVAKAIVATIALLAMLRRPCRMSRVC